VLTKKGFDQNGKVIVVIDPRYYRPTEVESLLGDASRARQELGWRPRTSFDQLVEEMMVEDLKEAERDALAKRHGYSVLNSFER
jgi:GDPmannose 4,6-dehydratase